MARRTDGWALGVDVGGTFTDAVLASGTGLFTAKVPTTPADQSEGVMAAVSLALERAGVAPGDVSSFGHGMTVATNALLEERGARTALIATQGFTDVLELARQTRPHLYRLCAARPAPLVPPELRFPALERNSPREVISPLDEAALGRTLDQIAAEEVESVAVCLLHSWARPDHERRVAQAVAERLPGVHVSASHDLLAVFREYERTSTTVIDAYLSPLLGGYLDRLCSRAAAAGLPAPEIMRSNGGLSSAAEAGRHAAWAVLSGPAAGAVGAAHAGRLSGRRPRPLVRHGRHLVRRRRDRRRRRAPVVGAGDRRTRAAAADGRRPHRRERAEAASPGEIPAAHCASGPRSAGAVPGPAAYGRGGHEPTVTDANLLLGYLSAEAPLAGDVRLDLDAARAAVGRLAGKLGLDVDETAAGIVRVADEEMLRALRIVTVERGVDPRGYALVAFGGAGPMHAARLAEQLGVSRVSARRAAGLLSALGLATADRRRDVGRSVLLDEAEIERGSTAARDRRPHRRGPRRHAGRARRNPLRPALPGPVLRVGGDGGPGRRYGRAARAVRARARGPLRVPRRPGQDRARERSRERDRGTCPRRGHPCPARAAGPGRRTALFDGALLETATLRGPAVPGESCAGPAVWELPEATAVVPPGWAGTVDEHGTLVLERA